ncbi:hypothetical protein AMTR_s00183p00054850 [Amborella trichopoda]|uniref:Uncharacterized protein n=1 Tax=Amborella trichopoda TaxID=13333 RepID=U5D8L9_AMBTC|nr:hypothetical protein AMTR_s00183p00054850 [Amborella trichopoda]
MVVGIVRIVMGVGRIVVGIVGIVVGKEGKGEALLGFLTGKMAKEESSSVFGICGIAGIIRTVGIVGGNGDNVGSGREGMVGRAGGGGVCNRRRAARQALSPSNDRTTSIAKRELLLEAMLEEMREKG